MLPLQWARRKQFADNGAFPDLLLRLQIADEAFPSMGFI